LLKERLRLQNLKQMLPRLKNRLKKLLLSQNLQLNLVGLLLLSLVELQLPSFKLPQLPLLSPFQFLQLSLSRLLHQRMLATKKFPQLVLPVSQK